MISHKHKCIFIHIGKTGGTSVEHILNPDIKLDPTHGQETGNTQFGEKHWTANQYRSSYPNEFGEYFKFAFVRNPWDLETSLWNWFRMLGHPRGNIEFDQFVKNRPRGGFNRHIRRGTELIVDFIGKFENFQEDFNVVCDKIGIPRQELPHTNKSKHKHYTEYYDDEAREIVAKKYAKDIEYFNYKFGE